MLLSVLLVLGLWLVPSQSKAMEKRLGSPFLHKCFEEAKKIVDDAYKYSREESLRRVRKDVVQPHDALRLMKQPRGDTRSAPRNQAQLAEVLRNPTLAQKLLELYGTPDNIDVWLGGVAEPFVPGGRVGPLLACLIATQFQRIRQGDRLWFQNPGVFTPQQRQRLSAVTLSRIICDNTGITSVPRDAFSVDSSTNRLVSCSTLPRLDLSAWTERPSMLCDSGSSAGCLESNGGENPTQTDELNNLDPLDLQDPVDPVNVHGPLDFQEPLDLQEALKFKTKENQQGHSAPDAL
ncbi:hypothetical protein CCH79_00000837, partial [Gambusia affinis]